MKILHVLAQLPSKTGSGVYYSNLIEEFKKFNYEQKAIFASQDEYSWDLLPKEDQYPVVFKSQELPMPIAGMSDVMPYENTVYSSMTEEMVDIWKGAFRKRLEKAKKEFNPDLVFSHHLWILTSMVREVFSDTKVIGFCHNTDLRQARMNPHIKERFVNNIDRLDLVFSISEQQRYEIEEIYGLNRNKIVSAGGGYNQKIFYPPLGKEYDDKIRLVYCGKIDPSKGVYELIEVFKSLGIDDVSLDIIGSPNDENRNKIERYIQNDPNIRLQNEMEQAALGDELRRNDIFIMPSFYEGIALIAIESLACGLYVVATEIEALRSLLGEEINECGVIEYVPLPRIYDTDKPVEEDLSAFKENLRKAILCQIEKVRNEKNCYKKTYVKIRALSWEGVASNIDSIINKL